ncbi:hypothetical protein ACIPR8_15395 [Stenotrophomonas sp. LARHCG68]
MTSFKVETAQHALAELSDLLKLMDHVIQLAHASPHHQMNFDADLTLARSALLRHISKLKTRSRKSRYEYPYRPTDVAFFGPTIDSVLDTIQIPPSARPSQAISALGEPRGLVVRAICQLELLTGGQSTPLR